MRADVVSRGVILLAGLALAGLAQGAPTEQQQQIQQRIRAAIDASTVASRPLQEFARTALVPLMVDATLIRETRAQNRLAVSLQDIKTTDKAWCAAEDELSIQQEKRTNAAATRLREIAQDHPAILEAFAMDDQGAVVGESQLTSDYWQGDEAKWTGSYAGGRGGLDVGEEQFDRSANAVLQQISLPLVDTDGTVVGAMTFGVALDRLSADGPDHATGDVSEAAAPVVTRIKGLVDGNAKLTPKLREFVTEHLVPYMTDAVLVRETTTQNGKRIPLSSIKDLDRQWQAAEEELPLHRELLGNATAEVLKALANTQPAILEAFAMDDQGAVVGESHLTSDYWQGDEAKWTGAYASGAGGIEVGDESFDRSCNAVLQQVSLPIVAADGKIIGALTFGIAVDRL
jgi:hypothetical protein